MGLFFGSKVMAEVARRINKKHKFVADGIFYAELNALLSKELAEDGYSGVEVRTAPNKTQIIIKATRTKNVLGEKGRRIQELTAVIEKRFNFKPDQLNLFAERVENRALCAAAQAESLLQVVGRSRCPSCLLWCDPIHHGIRCPWLRGHRFW